MCRKIRIHHVSCHTHGPYLLIPCSTPKTCGNPTIVTKSVAQQPYPDFCGTCFLDGRLFRTDLLEPERARILASDVYQKDTTYIRLMISSFLWEKARKDPSRQQYIDEFHSKYDESGISDMTANMLDCVMHLLNASFWRDVIEKKIGPGKFKRTLILQILSFQISDTHWKSLRELTAEDKSRLSRPKYLKDNLEHLLIIEVDADHRDCPICRDPIGVLNTEDFVESAVRTRCGHVFGQQCLDTWILDNETCPICRGMLLSFEYSETRYTEESEALRQRTEPPPWLLNMFGITPESREIDMEILSWGGPYFLLLGKASQDAPTKWAT